MNIPSECRIASIAPNHALILPNDANPGRIQFSERTGSWASMPPTIIDREFIDLWTRIPRFIGRLSTSASSHHDLSLAAFIANIAESDFRYTQVIPGGFIANPLFSSKALEHLIVARATTACGCGTVRVEKRGGSRNDGLSTWAAPMDWNFLFLGRS